MSRWGVVGGGCRGDQSRGKDTGEKGRRIRAAAAPSMCERVRLLVPAARCSCSLMNWSPLSPLTLCYYYAAAPYVLRCPCLLQPLACMSLLTQNQCPSCPLSDTRPSSSRRKPTCRLGSSAQQRTQMIISGWELS